MLTVVVPVRNEGDGFRRLHGELARHLPAESRIVVVFDRPDDTTVAVLGELQAIDPRVEPHLNPIAPGFVNALRAGFAVTGDGAVIVVMGDLSDDLSIVPAMLERYRLGARVVCPSRYMPGGRQIGGPLLKRTLSRLAGLSLYRTGALPVHDATNNFRLYDAAFLRATPVESRRGFAVALELTVKAREAGLRIDEIPTVWRDREWGASSFDTVGSIGAYLRWWLRAMARRRTSTES
jgi:glycosyltransferase involved in cell wall biosynthesis